jgi:hypothetical protein
VTDQLYSLTLHLAALLRRKTSEPDYVCGDKPECETGLAQACDITDTNLNYYAPQRMVDVTGTGDPLLANSESEFGNCEEE